MALSAADLQKRHELEGVPDPFPSLIDSTPAQVAKTSGTGKLDPKSESAFPSLAPKNPPTAAASNAAWGSSNGPRIKPAVSKQHLVTDSFALPNNEIAAAGKDGKPASLGETMKQVMNKFKVKLDASGNQKSNMTTFHIKAESQKELDKAKRTLLAQLSPVITSVLQAPASTIPTIIGSKGATLKQIRDQTNVKIDIPKREEVIPVNGHAPGTGSDEEEEEPTVPVTVTGPRPLVSEAQELLKQIIATKTSKTTQRVKDIPANVLPFIIARRSVFVAAAEGGEVKLSLNQAGREITVNGDREAVSRVVESIKSSIEQLKTGLTAIKVTLPKRQHRLLTGSAAEDIMAKAKCSVIVSPAADPSDEVSVWGEPADLPAGLQAVMEQANSRFIKEYQLPHANARQLLAYLVQSSYFKNLTWAHPQVLVYHPELTDLDKLTSVTVDIIGEKSLVEAVYNEIAGFVGKLAGATREVSVDWLLHKIIAGKQAKKIKQLHEAHNVNVYFPPESAEVSTILLVYDPLTGDASADKAKHLDDVEKELLRFAKEAADVKKQTITVEKRWHEAIVGEGGTTLNAIIGEDKTLSIKIGAEAADPAGEDVVVVRGISQDVDRAVKEILQIVEDAKNDEIVSSYSSEFDIDREYVGRIVGAQGSGINRLRDTLGVKVDVSDDVDEKEKESGKKKKAVHLHSRVKITGRKENVEEAKRRILAQVERLADETFEVLKIPAQYHSSLIGQGGKYAIRLEEKYSVKITFPRQAAENGEGRTREQLKPDEVLVKGGKKGVSGAKSELLEALEFEKESNNVLKFTIPTKSVARVLGRGGASINEIKDSTDAQIDIDKSAEDSSITHVTVRGTKKAIAAAKSAITVITDQIADETTATVHVEQKYHRTLIGAGGQGLRDLVSRCGVEADSRALANLIRFPRQGEPGDEVRLRGSPQVVNKMKAELEKVVKELRDRVVLGMAIPAVQHKALIGRGGQHLNDLQNRTGAQVQFPGSRSYNQVGPAENVAELKDVAATDIVKVSGPRAASEKAIAELKGSVKPPAPEAVTSTLEVPLKYHHAISQQGNFFRTLRSFGVTVDQSAQPQKSAVPLTPPANGSSARIDEPEDEGVQWQVVANYQDAEEGDSTWTFRARDQAGLDRALKMANEAIEQAKNMAYIGYLTLPDRSMFARIVGSKGSNVSRLRQQTGADITVSRDSSVIVIMGAQDDIVNAKEEIVKMISDGSRRRQ